MEKRVLRPRKEPEKENCQHQPVKRTRRAISTIERSTFREVQEVQPMKRSSSTQTDCCLTVTNALLTQELIAKNDFIQQKDQKYINMLERSYLQKEKLSSQIHEQQLEIARLNQQIQSIQNAPLIEFENNGETNIINFEWKSVVILVSHFVFVFVRFSEENHVDVNEGNGDVDANLIQLNIEQEIFDLIN